MNSQTKLIAVFAVFFLFSTEALAASIRCGNHVIHANERSGPGKYEVLKRCGSPTDSFGNSWVYERKGGKRVVIVFKDNGQISSIKRVN